MGLPTAATTAEMNGVTGAATGAILYNLEENKIFVFDGTNWVSTSNDNWLVDGNTGLPTTSFLGHIDDVRMEIRSNNLPLLQFGRRQTLGLVQGFPDYTDVDQPLVLLNGDGTTSALQFTATGASFYRPIFFTTTNGSFRLKGSTGGTDLFEIGSAGPANDGRLEFIIGDDGAEPIIFKRYDYRRGQFHREFFRVQGSNNTADATTRFGINLNTQEVPIDADYDDSSAGFTIANSTFQVEGSISKSILTTTGNLTLTENHYTIILGGIHTITFPAANTCQGRIYSIKNPNNNSTTISSYVSTDNSNQTIIPNESVLWVQSDGTNWIQINNNSATNTSGLQYYTWDIPNTSQPDIDNIRSLGVSTSQGLSSIPLNNTSRATIAPDADGYILFYSGTINVQNTGLFTFNARSDDGTRIYIDNVLIVENWFDQGPTTRSGSVTLAAGEHNIEFWYYENGGGDFMQFTWGANPDGYTVGSDIDATIFFIK
ncbi:PA14 domain-containing protein [Aquimarina sp. 2201CG14-23]|uniref:PA14 domain-containing protein n=1 Tax=Aquimarina mycalae TaxID=3040073 RepID=UPI002477FF65|nr:PA14 domain-containing protein [Aquimarina sp. 2201CG14-23]MDH7445063.1 PA14 domain-containing protein [Aquimarina sp. 2201CG14-23]